MEHTSLCRLLEINGTNVASKTHRETNKLLQHHHQEGIAMKIVVARPLESDFALSNDGSPSTAVTVEQYQKWNASLKAKLEFQNAEADHWKQECERYNSEKKINIIVKAATDILVIQISVLLSSIWICFPHV